MSVTEPEAAARVRLLFRRTAFAAAVLTFIVIVASAFMRHTQAGLACGDWPACYGRITAAIADTGGDASNTNAGAAPSAGVRVARIFHRLAATGVLALIVGLLLVAWTQKPRWKREGLLAAAALGVAGSLAVLGIATPGAMLPAVTLGNLLGGYLMLALLVATYAHASATDAAPTGRARWIAGAALVLAFAQAALGGTIGAQYALTACPTLGACPGMPFDQAAATTAFDPFRPLSVAGGRIVPPADAAGVHVMHRLFGIVVTMAALVVALTFRRTCRRAALLLAACAVAAPLLGAAAILALPSLPLTVLHNAVAALTIATLAAVAARR